MRRAERSIAPVLAAMIDNVLYLKHNLNARAISSLRDELDSVDDDVNTLISTMQAAINESNQFIADLKGGSCRSGWRHPGIGEIRIRPHDTPGNPF